MKVQSIRMQNKALVLKTLIRDILRANMEFKVFFLLTIFAMATQAIPTAVEDPQNSSESSSTDNDTNDVNHTTHKPLTNSTTEDEIDEAVEKILNNVFSKLDVFLVQVNDDAVQKCISNNETEALAKAKGADKEKVRCFFPAIDVGEIDIDSLEVETIKNYSQRFCNVYQALEEKCVADYYSNIKQCLSDADMKGMKIFNDIVSAGMKYVCQLDPDLFTKAVENEFGCNLMEHFASLVFCIVPPFHEIVRNHNNSMTIPRTLVGKGCSLYKDMAQCVHEELKTCKNQTYSDIIVGYFNATANALPECPSERTVWEQYMGEVLEKLNKEEQVQNNLLKSIKADMVQLIAAKTQQEKFYQEDKIFKQKMENVFSSIVKHVSGL